MKIVLINPPSSFLIDQKVFPPLSILYLAAVLRENGYNTEAIDLGFYEDWEKRLEEIRADFIGLTSTTPQALNLEKIYKTLRKNNSEAFFVIGGNHATAFPEKFIEMGFDSVIVGEGENAILELANKLIEGKKPEKIIKKPFIEDIDAIPFPARDLIPIKDYEFLIGGKNATTVMTSRGCPFRCTFCSNNVWGKTVRQRSSKNVIEEVKELKEKYGFKRIMFFDDTFIINRKRVFEICDGLKEIGIKWRCFIRSNLVDNEMLKKMKDSGCVEVGVGIESGSQKILDIIKKDTTVEMNSNVIKMCKKIGLIAKAFIMLGLPGETHETLEETKKWILKTKPDKYDLTIYMPYAQSEIWDYPEKFDIKFDKDKVKYSWYKGKKGDLHCYVSTSELNPEDILNFREKVIKEVGFKYN